MNEQDRLLKSVWISIGVLILGAATIWLVERLWAALIPFVFGTALYVALKPLADWFRSRGLSDGLSSVAATLAGFLALVILGSIVVPLALKQSTSIVASAPEALTRARTTVSEVLETGAVGRLRIPEAVLPQVREEFESLVNWAIELVKDGAAFAIEGAAKAGELLLNVILAFIVAYWFMRDAPRLRREIVRFSASHGGRVDHIIGTATKVSAGYLRGQAIACGSTSILVGIALSTVGVPYALAIAVMTFFLDFVPYLGATTSAVLAVIAGLFGNRFGLSPLASAALAGSLVVLSRWVTDVLVIPKVMSEEVDIHPLIVIAALLVGATGFGMVGILLAIPVAGILQAALVYWWETKTGETLASEDGALFRTCEPREALAED